VHICSGTGRFNSSPRTTRWSSAWSALGVEDDLEVDQLSLDLHPGDRFLLCTDGLTTMLSQDQIQEILKSEADPQGAADRLVEAANQAGGGDNITVIVLAIEDDSEDGSEPSSGDRTAVGPPYERSMSEDPSGGGVRDRDATRLWKPDAKATASSGPGQVSGPASSPAGRKRRWRRVAVWIGGILLILVVLVVGLRAYVDRQWYVGNERGCVAIFNGIPTTILGYELSHPEEGTNVATDDATRLAPWRNLTDGITANSLEDARAIVEQIRLDVSAQPPTTTRCASTGAPAGGSP
jgi:protein phosphatase